MSRTRFIRSRSSAMPPRTARAPPTIPDRPPTGTTGIRASAAIRTIAATSSVEPGQATRSGCQRVSAGALSATGHVSWPYARRSSGRSETTGGPDRGNERIVHQRPTPAAVMCGRG